MMKRNGLKNSIVNIEKMITYFKVEDVKPVKFVDKGFTLLWKRSSKIWFKRL